MDATCFDSSVHSDRAGDSDLGPGWSPIDALHEEFAKLVRALLHAYDEEVGAALQAVHAHTLQQFADEERWIQETGFPTFGYHADEHAAVLASMSCVSRKVASGDTQAGRVFAHALIRWHAGHAKHLDSRLARWICERSLGRKLVGETPHVTGAQWVPSRAH